MRVKHIFRWCLVLMLLTPVLAQAQRDACRERVRQAAPTIQRHCVGLNQDATLEGNPFVYTNPDAGCDLGLSMPGLPSIGGIGFDMDSCQILQAVTGSLVNDINSQLRDAVNQVDRAAGQADIDIDVGGYVEDRVR